MKRFLIHISLFILLIGISIISILSMVNEKTDPFYFKFTSSKKESLILGSSKASIGLQPSVLDKELNTSFLNYGFTIGNSPYGPYYLSIIKKKLDNATKNGVFILTVDCWSISSFKENLGNEKMLRESIGPVGETEFVNLNPNVFYAFNSSNLFKKVFINNNNSLFLNKDGWIEVKNIDLDSAIVADRSNELVKKYSEEKLPRFQLSQLRINYLKKTISYLKNYGEVYLVRLPVSKKMNELEDSYLPNFNKLILEISKEKDCSFLDMNKSSTNYLFTDGLHLQTESGKLASKEIARWISNH